MDHRSYFESTSLLPNLHGIRLPQNMLSGIHINVEVKLTITSQTQVLLHGAFVDFFVMQLFYLKEMMVGKLDSGFNFVITRQFYSGCFGQ